MKIYQVPAGRRAIKVVASIGLALFMMVPAVISYLAVTVQVQAANEHIGPNPEWFGASNNARYALENDTNVSGATQMVVSLYVKNTGPTEGVSNNPAANVKITASDFTKGYIANTLSAVTFTSDTGAACSFSSGPHSSGTREFTIDKSCFTYVGAVDAWRVEIKALLANNAGSIQFRLTATSANPGLHIFGYSASNSAQAFAIANQYRCDSGGQTTGCDKFYNFAIPFGTPCNVASATVVRAEIYDGDNTTSNSQYNIQYDTAFSVQVMDVTNPAAPTLVSYTFSGSTGNNMYAYYDFTVQPSHKYQFRVNNVYTNNVLQFRIPYDSIESITDCTWDLRPNVTLNTTAVEAESSGIDVNYGLTNVGIATSKTAVWQLSRCRVPANAAPAAYTAAADNTSNGVTTYNALGASCQQVTSGSGTFVRGVTGLGVLQNQSIGNEPVGTRICFVLSVNPPTDKSAANVWRHGLACVIVGKKPKAQIWGNDLSVGNAFFGQGAVSSIAQGSTSTRTISGTQRTFGSWVEYGILATGLISGVGSASAYAEQGLVDKTVCKASVLSFINAASGTCLENGAIGNYASSRALPDVAASFATKSTTPAIADGASVSLGGSGLRGLYSGTGTITVNGGALNKGEWVVINAPNANVVISGNITYTNAALASIDDIPQAVIIAKNIQIAASVTRIDGWLVAKGTGTDGVINTCNAVATTAALTTSVCNAQLTVNGPVIAKQLFLRRTAGSDIGTPANPAEVFNLRPDAYLWALSRSAASGRLQTVYSTEAAPRL